MLEQVARLEFTEFEPLRARHDGARSTWSKPVIGTAATMRANGSSSGESIA
jgi:hypothetical protein